MSDKHEGPATDLPGIELSEAESEWQFWLSRQNGVDTPHCDCGHDGMGPGWHANACSGAAHAYATMARACWLLAWSRGARELP